MDFKYDVALSFAGENRSYVDKVAEVLKANGVKVFYDKFEQVDLWGKDLGLHFDYVYRRASRYFIPFISEYYKEKVWTNYEVRTAIARSIENKEEYILPVKLDGTELEGIRSTIGYLDVSKILPEDFAVMVLEKLEKEQNIPLAEKEESSSNVYLSTYLSVSEYQGISAVSIGVTVTNTVNAHRYFHGPLFQLSKPIEGNMDTFQLFDQANQLSFPKRMEYGEQYHILYELKPGFLRKMEEFKNSGVTLTAVVKTTLGEKFYSKPMKIDDLFKYKVD